MEEVGVEKEQEGVIGAVSVHHPLAACQPWGRQFCSWDWNLKKAGLGEAFAQR